MSLKREILNTYTLKKVNIGILEYLINDINTFNISLFSFLCKYHNMNIN